MTINENLMPEYVKKLQPTTLYNSSSGSNGETISLSDSSANYTYIEVFFRSTDNVYNSVKAYQPNGKIIDLTSRYYLGGVLYAKTSSYTFDGSSLTRTTTCSWWLSSSSQAVSTSSDIYITRIIGYK